MVTGNQATSERSIILTDFFIKTPHWSNETVSSLDELMNR
jgi:hypothetical protein